MGIFRYFGRKLHGPRCHLTTEKKTWVERRMIWLHDQFGDGPIRRAPLDPCSELLPRKWDNSWQAGTDLFNRLREFMRVDPARVQVRYFTRSLDAKDSAYAGETNYSGPAGLYGDPQNGQALLVGLEYSGLKQPAALAATICHELAHVHLLADKRIPREAPDCEPLTDLLTVYFGAGIFVANAAFQFNQWSDVLTNRRGWSATRLGYLSEQEFGYALACYSWYRGERAVAWSKYLRENIAYYFDDSIHFLSATRDTAVPFNGA